MPGLFGGRTVDSRAFKPVAVNPHFETLPHPYAGPIFNPVRFSEFFNAGSGWGDAVKIVFFRMLPRGAQIEKVRSEFNTGLLKQYGTMTRLEIDKESKAIHADLNLKGESGKIQVSLKNYRLIQEGGNPVFELGAIEVSREWLDALLKNCVKTSVIPGRMEIKKQLHQIVLKSLL